MCVCGLTEFAEYHHMIPFMSHRDGDGVEDSVFAFGCVFWGHPAEPRYWWSLSCTTLIDSSVSVTICPL